MGAHVAGRLVVDLHAAVTDTHTLLYHARGASRLGPVGRRLFQAAEERHAVVHIPAAVIWEVSFLARTGRIDLRRSARAFFEDLLSNPSFHPHDLDARQVLAAADWLQFRDPFDALICASAADLSLPLITRDAVIEASGLVRTVW